MATKEEDILAAIKEAELEKKEAKSRLDKYKKAFTDAESDLIAANLRLEKLAEELRVCRVTSTVQEKEYRERDIEAFRAKMPELRKKGYL